MLANYEYFYILQVKTNPWSNTVTMVNGEKRIYHYDAEHERKRKEQLRRLFDRTQDQVCYTYLLY